METPPSKCPQCGGAINYIPKGISSKSGKPYSEFWACEKRCGFTWRPPSRQDKQHEETMEALRKIYKEIDDLRKEFKAFRQIFSNKS